MVIFHSYVSLPEGNDRNAIVKQYPDAPWCWNIYLQNCAIFVVNVGKYCSIWDSKPIIKLYEVSKPEE